MRNSDHCPIHAHRIRDTLNDGHRRMRYAKALGPRLSDIVKSQMEGGPNEQMAIFDEIGVARAMLTESMTLLKVASDGNDTGAKIMAMSLVDEGIQTVATLCEKAAKITNSLDTTIDAKYLGVFVIQILDSIRRTLKRQGYDEDRGIELATLIVKELENTLTVPEKGKEITMSPALIEVTL